MRLFIIALSLVFYYACSYDPAYTPSSEGASLVVLVDGSTTQRTLRATTWSSYHFSIHTKEGALYLDTTVANSGTALQLFLENLAVDEEYVLTVWTSNENHTVVHSPVQEVFNVVKDSTTVVNVALQPRVGSLQLQLSDVGSALDSISMTFTSDSGTFHLAKKQTTTVFFSLDTIPYGAMGVIEVSGYTQEGDTLLNWADTLTFVGGQLLEVQFSKSGALSVTVTVLTPPSSQVVGSAQGESLPAEGTTGILITEFCATAGSGSSSRDFVEIYNGNDAAQSFDALRLIVSGAVKELGAVVLQGHEYLTIGSLMAQEVWSVDSVITLDLTSTSGQIYLYNGNTLIDYVFYANDTAMGWEKLSSSAKRSWRYVGVDTTAVENNFPENWEVCPSVYTSFDGYDWYGTPGE